MRQFASDWWYFLKMDYYYLSANRGWWKPLWLYAIKAVLLDIALAWQALECRYNGHDFEDQSAIGPDSGTEVMYCKRCGYTHSHTYY